MLLFLNTTAPIPSHNSFINIYEFLFFPIYYEVFLQTLRVGESRNLFAAADSLGGIFGTIRVNKFASEIILTIPQNELDANENMTQNSGY